LKLLLVKDEISVVESSSMIVGNGLLAGAFCKTRIAHSKLIIFASGVSNSKETDPVAFERERRLMLSSFVDDKTLIYFSTCSIEDTVVRDTPYVRHKIEMETLVRTQKKYWIFRLPQVVGKTKNSHTLTNFLFQRIISGQKFDVFKDATRNIIDVDDVASIAAYMFNTVGLGGSETVNIATPQNISVLNLVNIFEELLGIAARFNLTSGGGSYVVDTEYAASIANKIGINFNDTDQYVRSVLKKYYLGKF
jgi:nucleoside-diphosphate-sugar epimerase